MYFPAAEYCKVEGVFHITGLRDKILLNISFDRKFILRKALDDELGTYNFVVYIKVFSSFH